MQATKLQKVIVALQVFILGLLIGLIVSVGTGCALTAGTSYWKTDKKASLRLYNVVQERDLYFIISNPYKYRGWFEVVCADTLTKYKYKSEYDVAPQSDRLIKVVAVPDAELTCNLVEKLVTE